MAWVWLLIAGLFEVGWAVGIKYCDGFKPTLALLIVIVSMTLSMVFLGMALKNISMGVAYSVWTGVGIVGVFLYQVLVFKEPMEMINVFFVFLILIGIIGLKLSAR
jgi:quaternary ammonium compound-resistance protein SugE